MKERNIDKRRRYKVVLDTETAGNFATPLCYDIGFVITDKKGNIYEKWSFVIKEVFENRDLMQSAYFYSKYDMYKEDLANGKRILATLPQVRQQLLGLCNIYGVDQIWAYNSPFDQKALQKSWEYFDYAKTVPYFLPYELRELKDIAVFAGETILQQKTYYKMALKHGFIKDKTGNLETTAQAVYRYISKDYDFDEDHTALEDAMIETQILAKCYNQHKKNTNGKQIKGGAWRLPQENFKKFKESLDNEAKE